MHICRPHVRPLLAVLLALGGGLAPVGPTGLAHAQVRARPAQARPARAARADARAAAAQGRTQAPKTALRRVLKAGKDIGPQHENVLIGAHRLLNREVYVDLRNAVRTLLEKYPPDGHYFIGLGRDPAPIIAMLQNIGSVDLAVNLPGTSGKKWHDLVTQDVYARFFEHFVPDAVLKGQRTIVLVDQTGSGGTLAQFAPKLEQYLQQRGVNVQVRRAAFSNHAQQPAGNERIPLDAFQSVAGFLNAPYEGLVPEHQRAQMNKNAVPTDPHFAPRAEYGQFRAAIRERMEGDAELDQFLSALRPVPSVGKAPPGQQHHEQDRVRVAPEPARPAPRPTPTRAFAPRLKTPPKAAGARPADTPLLQVKAGDATHALLDRASYDEVSRVAQTLVSQHSLERSYFVGVGRSSTALFAFLENLAARGHEKTIATYLPTDGLQKLAGQAASADLVARFQELFDKLIPAQVWTSGRDVVLFQHSASGQSLPFVQQLLAQYAAAKGHTGQVVAVPTHDGSGTAAQVPGAIQTPLALNDRGFFAAAPWLFHRPGSGDAERDPLTPQRRQPKQWRAEYQQFRDALAKRMSHDPAVTRMLGR